MYHSKNQGYGICGAKNVYSTSVHVGNWVEDEEGLRIISNPRPCDRFLMSLHREQYTDPAMRPEVPAPPGRMATIQELRDKNKNGLPYTLMFKHGKSDIPIEDRFMELNKKDTLDLSKRVSRYATPERTFEKAKQRMMAQDVALARDKTTEQRAATAQLNSRGWNSVPLAAVGRSDDLPVWNRRKLLKY
jgi:hypothetical protein